MTAAVLAIALRAACPHVEVEPLADLVVEEAQRFDVDIELAAAVMVVESTCRAETESGAGDLGLFQIRRGITTRGFDWMTDAGLKTPRVNVHLGVRRLALARARCGGGAPAVWLGGYSGHARCESTSYARRVLSRERWIKRQTRSAPGPDETVIMMALGERGHVVGMCTAPVRAPQRRAEIAAR